MSAGAIGGVAGAMDASRKDSCANTSEMLERAEETGALLEQTLAERKEATEESRRRLCLLKAKLKAAMELRRSSHSPGDAKVAVP